MMHFNGAAAPTDETEKTSPRRDRLLRRLPCEAPSPDLQAHTPLAGKQPCTISVPHRQSISEAPVNPPTKLHGGPPVPPTPSTAPPVTPISADPVSSDDTSSEPHRRS